MKIDKKLELLEQYNLKRFHLEKINIHFFK